MNIITVALLTGFFGDMLLQFSIRKGMGGTTGWGLKSYFEQHGSAESWFIAGGMLALFMSIYVALFKYREQSIAVKLTCLALFGIILDLFFRKTMIFPSLKGYYQNFNYVQSAFWGAFPMVLIGLVDIAFTKMRV